MKKAINQSLLSLILNGVSILALLFMMYSLLSYSRVSGQLSDANEVRYELTYNANRFMNGSSYLTNEVRAYAATGDKRHYDNYWEEVNTLKNRDLGVAAMQEIGITEEEQAMIDAMFSLSNELVPLEENAMEEVQNGDRESALDYVYGTQYSASITEINSLKEQFLEDLDKRTLEQVEELFQKADDIKIMIFLALLLVGVMQLINMAISRWRILRPVIKVKDQMEEISKGNLSAEFPLRSDTSEIGRLVESIHETKRELRKYISDIDSKLAQMAQGNMDLTIDSDYLGEFQPIQNAMSQILDALNQALFRINLTADRVSEESNQMASGAQMLSEGTVEQAAAVQELTASIQDISKQVSYTSQDADDARNYSKAATEQLGICDQKMEALKTAMEDISKASKEIGGIIKTIEDIAFQTNILALNAAVEASHAGIAGKGFAVVADEVKNLANKSSVSAQNITELIENSMKLVQYGTTLSADTMEAMSTVVSSAQKSTEMVERIADSARQQVQSIDQISQGMEQISEVVQTNAATAEKSAASARELQSQAQELKISVHRFRLRQNMGN